MKLKLLLKKIIVALMAFIGLFTLFFSFCQEGFYAENGFTFMIFYSEFIIYKEFEWAIYFVGACSILIFLADLILALGAGLNFIFKKKDALSKPVLIASLVCSGLYALIGIIMVVINSLTWGKALVTSAYVPLILQIFCLVGYILVGKLVPETVGGNKQVVETKDASSKAIDYNELEKLAKLKNEGVITEEEFIAKKKEILGL